MADKVEEARERYELAVMEMARVTVVLPSDTEAVDSAFAALVAAVREEERRRISDAVFSPLDDNGSGYLYEQVMKAIWPQGVVRDA